MNDRFGFAVVTWPWLSWVLWGGWAGSLAAPWLRDLLSVHWGGVWHVSSSRSLPSPGAAPGEAPLAEKCFTENCSRLEGWMPAETTFVDNPSAAWECQVRLNCVFCCWNLAVLSMIPMNGVLRARCSVPWAWLRLGSLSRTSGPSPLTLPDKLLAEVKLLDELARMRLLDEEAEEPPLGTGLCCLESLKFTGAEAVDVSPGLDLQAKEREERVSGCCGCERWLDTNFSLCSSAVGSVEMLPDENMFVSSPCWVPQCRVGKGLWGRCCKDDCGLVLHWLPPALDPGWMELRCWFVFTICACFVGCIIKPGSLRYLLLVLLWGDTHWAFWTPSWRVLLNNEAAEEHCSLCGGEIDSLGCGRSSSLSWRLKLLFTPDTIPSSSLSELLVCSSSCGHWCFCCCVLWNCLHSSSTRAKSRFISWLLGHIWAASRRSERAASSFLFRNKHVNNENWGKSLSQHCLLLIYLHPFSKMSWFVASCCRWWQITIGNSPPQEILN